MRDLSLRNIPLELYKRLEASAAEQFRDLDQEVLARLNRSFDAEDARMSAVHARWVHEALTSGRSTPLKPGELDQAFAKGITQARVRKSAKAA